MYSVECEDCGCVSKFSDDNWHPWCMMCCGDSFDWSTQIDYDIGESSGVGDEALTFDCESSSLSSPAKDE